MKKPPVLKRKRRKAPKKLGHPLISIWLHPAETIKRIIDTDPRLLVVPLAVTAGTAIMLSSFDRSGGLSLPAAIGLVVFLGYCYGMAVLYLEGGLLFWLGRRLGGKGAFIEVRAAVAWGMAPRAALVILYLLRIARYGEDFFTRPRPGLDLSPFPWNLLFPFSAVETIVLWTFKFAFNLTERYWDGLYFFFTVTEGVLFLWAIFLVTFCLSKVHRFSGRKGFLTLVLSEAAVGAVLGLVFLVGSLSVR